MSKKTIKIFFIPFSKCQKIQYVALRSLLPYWWASRSLIKIVLYCCSTKSTKQWREIEQNAIAQNHDFFIIVQVDWKFISEFQNVCYYTFAANIKCGMLLPHNLSLWVSWISCPRLCLKIFQLIDQHTSSSFSRQEPLPWKVINLSLSKTITVGF